MNLRLPSLPSIAQLLEPRVPSMAATLFKSMRCTGTLLSAARSRPSRAATFGYVHPRWYQSNKRHNASAAAAATVPIEHPKETLPAHKGPVAATLVNEAGENVKLGALGRTTSGKRLNIRTYPNFASLEEERLYRKQHLAAAFRVFADRGYDEGVAGHISVRDPILTDHFWLNPLSQHFSTICVSDLILVNEEGHVVLGDQPINAAAFAIHSEIHKARPDVHAACHAHSVYGKAFSVFGRELDMMTQDALRFYKSHAVYTNFGGVVLDREEGKRIAETLGNGKAVILMNHGLLTVGKSVDEAAFWFLSLDRTCHAQLLADAASAGSGHPKRLINEEEARFSYENVGTPEKGWLAFQGYYDEMLQKTNGSFLR